MERRKKYRATWKNCKLPTIKINFFKKSRLIARVLKMPANQPCLCARDLSAYVTQGREGVWDLVTPARRPCPGSKLVV